MLEYWRRSPEVPFGSDRYCAGVNTSDWPPRTFRSKSHGLNAALWNVPGGGTVSSVCGMASTGVFAAVVYVASRNTAPWASVGVVPSRPTTDVIVLGRMGRAAMAVTPRGPAS